MKLHQKLFWLLALLLPVQLGYHFWPNFSLVLGLRVDYLSPTLYLTDILVFLILCLWGFEAIINSQLSILNFLKKYWWVLAIFIFFLVNSLLAQNSGAALYKFIKIVELTFFGVYVAKNIFVSQDPRILKALSLAGIYSSLIAIAQFIKQSSLGGFFWWLGERTFNVATPGIAKAILGGRLIMRPYGTFPHPNVLAGFLLISLILTFPYLFQKNKLLASGYCLLVIFALAISFSRSVWIVSILICLWLVIQWWRKIKIKKPLGYTVWSLLFVVGCWLLVVGFFVYFGAHFSTNEAFFQRWQLMRAAFLMIKSAPLAGVGLNNFIVCLPAFWSMIGFTYWLQPVHNFYLLLASETGFVGLLILGWFLFLTFKNLWKIENCSFKGITPKQLQIALIVILLLGLVDHYWLTLQQTQLLLAIVLGLSWSSKI